MRSRALDRHQETGCPRGSVAFPTLPSFDSLSLSSPDVAKLSDFPPEFGDVQPFADWLNEAGCPVAAILAATPGEAKPLPAVKRQAYRAKVILGTFVAEWLRRHRGQGWDKLKATDEGKLFQTAIVVINDENAFRKSLRNFTRLKPAETGKARIRDATAFQAFVIDGTSTLAARMLKGFDSGRPGANRTALSYLVKVSVSQFLKGALQEPACRTRGSVLSYLAAKKTRLGPRVRLAFKLAYIPLAMTADERNLAEHRGIARSDRPVPVYKLAKALGFKGAAALSRKLYRVRAWAKKWGAKR